MPQTQHLADSVEQIVVGAVGLTARALSKAAPGVELTFPQWRAMLVVGEEGDGVPIGHVARRIGITSPATGRLLRRLRQRGLVTMAPDPHDGRVTLVRLTGVGDETRGAIVSYRRRALRTLARSIPPAEREGLARAASTIAAEFSRYS